MVEWLAATYKWDLKTIAEVTPAQIVMLYEYAQRRIGGYFKLGESIIGSITGTGGSGSAAPVFAKPHRRGGMVSIDSIELSPEIMAEAHERMKEIRKQKGRKLPLPEGEMETYMEQGMVRKIIRQKKKPEKPKE